MKPLFGVFLWSIKIAYPPAVADAGVICWEMVHNTLVTVESSYPVQKSCLPTTLPTTEDYPLKLNSLEKIDFPTRTGYLSCENRFRAFPAFYHYLKPDL